METKSFLASKTMLGAGLVMLAPLLDKLLGVQLDAALQADLSDLITNLLQYGGALLAMYGRIKATKKLAV